MTRALRVVCDTCGTPGRNVGDWCNSVLNRSGCSGTMVAPLLSMEVELTPAQRHRARILALQAEEEALIAALALEAIPAMQREWEASPGRVLVPDGIFICGEPFMRVGLVERKGEATVPPMFFDFVWLEVAAYVPFPDEPELYYRSNGCGKWVLGPILHGSSFFTVPVSARAAGTPGVVWLREEGMPRPNWGDRGPWITTIQHSRGDTPNAIIENVDPAQDADGINPIEDKVFPAAREWLHQNPTLAPLLTSPPEPLPVHLRPPEYL